MLTTKHSSEATAEKTTALRPAHRRTGRGTAKCAELRDVAATLFLARGYDGVSLDEIVRAAGGSKTNVYGFFGGKEGLFLAAVETRCLRLQARLAARDLAGLGLEEGLRALGRDLVDLLLEPDHLALYRLVIGGTARFPGLGALWYENGPLASRGVFAALLARHTAALPGGVAPDELALAFHDLAVTDLLRRAVIGGPVPDAGERARAVDAAIRLVLAR